MKMRQNLHGLQHWHGWLPVLFAAFLVWIYPKMSWDYDLIAPYFDAVQQRFFLKDDYFLDNIMHGKLKMGLQAIAAALVILWAASWKLARLRPHRRRLMWLCVGIVLTTLTVTLLKRVSGHACPWDLARYGGQATELSLFGQLPAGEIVNGCLPGGHASGGYALLVFYFGFLVDKPRWAKAALCVALVFGTAMGWSQMMRGAHFLSHNLWTLWVVWVVLLAWYASYPPLKPNLSLCESASV
jgi:membrane-associated PAP2 superfamily phosphatase